MLEISNNAFAKRTAWRMSVVEEMELKKAIDMLVRLETQLTTLRDAGAYES